MNHKTGFTLIELLIATSIFIIVSSVSVASFLAASKSVRKLQSDREVHQAARTAFEQMSREIRQARSVACNNSDSPASDCQPSSIYDQRLKTNYLRICNQDGTLNKDFLLKNSRIRVRTRPYSASAGVWEQWSDWDDLTPGGINVTGQYSDKLFLVYPSHLVEDDDDDNPCDDRQSNSITLQPFAQMQAEFSNFSDPAIPPERQAKITLQTMVSLRNFVKQY